MPFSANAWSRIDTPRRARPARALGEWDHDSEGDVFVPPPPDALPASLRPSRSNDAWLLHAPGASSAAGPGLVRRGRHAPARDGSESSDVHRLRVRLAQLEPVLDDARRDARLAARAQRTAAAERDRTRATLAATRRDASETIERARSESEAAREATKTATRASSALRRERDALVQKLALAEAETKRAADALRVAHREKAAGERRREEARATSAAEEAKKKPTARDAATRTRAPEIAFAELLASTKEDAYRAGFRDGEQRGRDETREAFVEERRLAEAARDAAHARASDAEARVARLAARLDSAREAAAAERRRAAAAAKKKDANEAASRAKASAAAEALAAAETREGVFRARLEAMALAFAARNQQSEKRFHVSRAAPSDAPPPAPAKKKGRAPRTPKTSATHAKTADSGSEKKEKGVSAPSLRAEPVRDENGRAPRCERKEGGLPDWLPEVRPPPAFMPA